jgi:uncharacterized protein (DUF1697 family)
MLVPLEMGPPTSALRQFASKLTHRRVALYFSPMPVIVALLRGINLGRHNRMNMDALRLLCESLEFEGARTYVQSGNVVFKTKEKDLARLSQRIADEIERTFNIRCAVILRTSSQLRAAAANNPFAGRRDVDPSRLLVIFLARDPTLEAGKQLRNFKADPEEVRVADREVYLYFPNGVGRSKLSFTVIEKISKTPATARNWNTVTKLPELAESLENSKR